MDVITKTLPHAIVTCTDVHCGMQFEGQLQLTLRSSGLQGVHGIASGSIVDILQTHVLQINHTRFVIADDFYRLNLADLDYHVREKAFLVSITNSKYREEILSEMRSQSGEKR